MKYTTIEQRENPKTVQQHTDWPTKINKRRAAGYPNTKKQTKPKRNKVTEAGVLNPSDKCNNITCF